MRLLRLLTWLRLKLWWRSLAAGGRWVAILGPIGLFVLFWPVWFGGSVGSWWAVREMGRDAFPLVTGLVQMIWVSTSVLAASVGRALMPRQLLRYPVRPGALFAFNAAAGALEPATLVLLAPLAALIAANFVMRGPAAGLATLAGVALSLALTLTLLQLLLAVLERLLRTEWMRMASRMLLSLVFLGVSWSYSELADTHLVPALTRRAPLLASLSGAATWLERFPGVSAPGAVADLASGGAPRALAGLAACAAMLAAMGWLGTRLMVRGAVEPDASGVAGGSAAIVEALAGLVPRRLANLVRFDLLVQARSPRGLLWVLLTPLLISAFYMVHPSTAGQAPLFATIMTITTLSQVSLMLYAHYGPGIRTLYLVPVPPRDVVLARNLTYAMETALLVLLLGALFGAMRSGLRPAQLPEWGFGGIAMVAVMLATGNELSIRHPVRVTGGWGGQRSVGWLPTLSSFAVNGLTAVLLVGSAWLAHRLAPRGFGDAAGATVLAAEAAAALFVWWRSLDRAAALFHSGRERMIEALARESPAG